MNKRIALFFVFVFSCIGVAQATPTLPGVAAILKNCNDPEAKKIAAEVYAFISLCNRGEGVVGLKMSEADPEKLNKYSIKKFPEYAKKVNPVKPQPKAPAKGVAKPAAKGATKKKEN